VSQRLEATASGDVAEERLPVEYQWVWMNGHWVHRVIDLTRLEVDLGHGRTVLVDVTETEVKN